MTTAIRLSELVDNHTEFLGEEALYTAAIVLVMNKDKYNALPDDLRAILDAESGLKLSTFATGVMVDMDAPGREIGMGAGNNIIQLSEDEVARWKAASAPVVERWISDMEGLGIDGQALIDRARGLIDANAM